MQRLGEGRRRLMVIATFFLTTAAASAAPARDEGRLVAAARQNDGAAVRRLLRQGADVNERQADGGTALLWAAYYQDRDSAERLIAAGADVTAANVYGETPLTLACEYGDAALATLMLEAGADATVPSPGGVTLLMRAARAGSVPLVRALVAGGAPVNVMEPEQHQTALMSAAAHRQAAVVDALLALGATVNAASRSGSTALHFAVQQGDLPTATRLLAAGADVHARLTVRQIDGFTLGLIETLDGLTPLLLAIADCRQDGPEYDGAASALVAHPVGELCPVSEALGRLLLDHGADPNAADGSRIPPLHQAVRARMPALAAALIAHGADVNARVPADVKQWRGPARRGARIITPMPVGATPFFVAAWAQSTDLMRALVELGADTRLAADDHTTPLMAAAGVIGRPAGMRSRGAGESPDALEAVKIAVASGGNVAAVNDAGRTAVHGAAAMALDHVVEFLVEKGARLDLADTKGDTPLSLAARAEAQSTVALVTRLGGGR